MTPNTWLTLLLISSLSAYCNESIAAPPISEYTATYSLYWHGVKVGTSSHTVEKISNTSTHATVEHKPIISILPFRVKEISTFSIHNQQVTPQQFSYQNQHKKKKYRGQMTFNWNEKTIYHVIEEKTPEIDLLPEKIMITQYPQDKVSVNFQLREDLRQNKTLLSYTVIEADKIKTYSFRIVGYEILKTAIGEYDAIILEHLSQNKERLTTLWLAKDLDYILLKCQQKIKDKNASIATIKSLSIPSPL